MSTVLRSFYHNLDEAIIICDGEEVYFNKAFKNVFSDIIPKDGDGNKILKKLDYKFNFDFCLIESEKLATFSPIREAVLKKGNVHLYGMYQKNEREFLYFLIHAFSVKKYRILYFSDITKDVMFEKVLRENEKLKIQNREFLTTNSKAQNQAVKMALLNRVATSISKTIDINDLINTAIKELGIIFGAKKVYFASRIQDKSEAKSPDKSQRKEAGGREIFKVEYVYPEKPLKDREDELLSYDKATEDEILDNKISMQITLNEYEGAKEPLKMPHTRIILPVTNNNRNVNSVVVILTAKKHIEDIEKELMRGVSMQISSAITQAMLFKAVSDKKEELENALSELKETQLQLINSEKMASLGQLIASVAHEINTPLASICANNEITKKFFEGDKIIDTETIEILRDTNSIDFEAIKRITNLVQSLKRFVRLDEMTRQAANINDELDLTLNLLHHKLKKNIKLVKNYGSLPLVECYPNMLNQVFLNILMNAIQSIEKQASVENAGLSGRAGEYCGEIIITTEIENDKLSVKIEDNGFGIKEEDKKKIFTAGFTTKKAGEGTGLGLAICKKIIDKHEGNIGFRSTSFKLKDGRIAKSTVFEITLPV